MFGFQKEKLEKGLERTKIGFFDKIRQVISGGVKIDDEKLDELEEMMILSDIGIETTARFINELRSASVKGELSSMDDVVSNMRAQGKTMMGDNPGISLDKKPFVIMMVGVNGSGKTTSAGKLANYFKSQGKTVILAAADTFRAAAVEQLKYFSDKVGVDFVGRGEGGDPAAVVYDAITAAIARSADVVIIDTAGRLQSNTNLMNELSKMTKVAAKLLPDAPHEVLLVLDATTGQNAISQAELFSQHAGVTGIILNKLDGTAKGGIVLSISEKFGIPIKFVGVGEKIDDIVEFDPDVFLEAMFPE